MAHWCPPHHSALHLPTNSVASQPRKSSQWRAESRRNKRVGYRNFWSRYGDGDTSPPKIWSMHLIICILFHEKTRKLLIWNQIQTSPYTDTDLEQIDLCIRLARNCIFCQTDQKYFPCSLQRTRSQTWNLEWPTMHSFLAYNIRIYSTVEDHETENKTCLDIWIWLWVRENGGSLDFNFISLLNSTVDKNWVCQHHFLQFIFGKWCIV